MVLTVVPCGISAFKLCIRSDSCLINSIGKELISLEIPMMCNTYIKVALQMTTIACSFGVTLLYSSILDFLV